MVLEADPSATDEGLMGSCQAFTTVLRQKYVFDTSLLHIHGLVQRSKKCSTQELGNVSSAFAHPNTKSTHIWVVVIP